MSSAITVTTATFEEEVLKSDRPVLVDFWAVWCGPCKMTEPIVDAIASELKDKLKVVKINVDEDPGLSGQYAVMSIPTLLLFKDGQPVETMIGVVPKREVESKINAHL